MPVVDDLVRYRHIARLGVGGMATVTLAEDTTLGRRVALKRLHAGGDGQSIPRLRREALVGASLSHPNLVSVYDVEVGEDGDLVIVMEYVAGETLREAIDASGWLPPAFALEVLDGVAAALDAIHARDIVHRDVKPANILLGREGVVKLADLGIALAADRTQITSPGAILGTFGYMAPEQLEGAAATPAADVYALAAVAFEMLSGQKARPQPNPVAVAHAIATRPPPDLCAAWPQAPPAAAAVLARGLDADPARRPRSAGELVGRLRAAVSPAGDTRPEPAPDPPVAPATVAPAAYPRPEPAPDPPVAPATAAPATAAPATAAPATAAPAAYPRPEPAPDPPVAPATVGASGRQGPAAGRRTAAAGASAPRVRPVLILAGLGVCGLAAMALALGDAGGGAGRTPVRQPAASSPVGAASSPASAVRAFYGHAARHEYASAWALADPAFRTQLAGYDAFAAQQSQVRRITFDRVATTTQGPAAATVAIQTTAVLSSGTQHCRGPVQLVRSPGGGWRLHQISIDCVPA